MHGRLKVKTTAEQQEAKRIEREKKLKLYKAGTSKVFQKQGAGEYDVEGLAVTGNLLSANPDFYSLWNYRRETFQRMKNSVPAAELKESMLSELGFLEQCLRTNPKSYGTWHHRGWVLQNMPQPDWARELLLCNKFLEYDERNFHCWDYRRLVVKESNVSAEEELSFTTSKIELNFSNYSSWHYRSKLLPVVRRDEHHPVGITEETLVNECMLAQNAFFTDPNDQSAWFYHRWLLGRVARPLRLESFQINRINNKTTVSLSKADNIRNEKIMSLSIGANRVSPDWYSPSGESNSHIWICQDILSEVEGDAEMSITVGDSEPVVIYISSDQNVTEWRRPYRPGTRFCDELSAVTSDVLTQELSSLQQLHDLEPDNKWVLLTIVSVMRALNPLNYEQETLNHIDKLIIVDPLRTNYYLDLKSKFIIENCLEVLPHDCSTLDLSNKQLHTLSHTECMATLSTINLSNNSLQSLSDLSYLQCAQVIKLDSNRISNCKDFRRLGSLEELSICDNNISSMEDLQALQSCPRLTRLHLKGNPVCERKTDIVEFLMSKSQQKET